MKKFIFLFFVFQWTLAFSFDHQHQKWNDILQKYTLVKKKQVLVNYKSLLKNTSELNNYLTSLSEVTPKTFAKFTKNQKICFWINAYNAFTVKLILDHYPVKSIKDIGSFFSSPWSKEFISLMGKKMSLDEIEHETIRKNFSEPRIHFAVNCASVGCPSLYQEAFRANKMDEQLEVATSTFLKNRSKNYRQEKVLYLSKIFKWYSEDFGDNEKNILAFVGQYLDVKGVSSVKYLDYDWSLNSLENGLKN
ncbi:MAG: DUF547 domain-containing protein [Bacteriovoracaceae bacterium]|jgi:hypothetical protein|nr:DUF547 domain-containing protein [Bacteriovoracaceae bacterium]